MSVFDKFFERYSYRFPKGYPDFTNKQDILVLENIFNEINLFEANTAEGNKFIVDIINQNSEKLGFELDRLNDESKPPKLYFKGIPSKGQREIRLDLLNILGSLLPDNKFINTTKDSPEFTVVVDGQKHKFGIKGAGSDYSTETLEKEGLVIFFYNSPIKKLFTPESLIENVEVLSGDYYKGINTKPERVQLLLSKYIRNIESAANNKVALATLNDPLSSAIAIKKAYGNEFPLITGS